MARRLEFDFEWRITLFTLALLPLLISLGFWQLQRAEEKATLAVSFEQQQSRPPAPLDGLWRAGPESLAYLPVALAGQFRDSEYFLLDNRMSQRRYGNEVLAVFELESGDIALVNRGWVPADPARQTLPAVPTVPGKVQITGHVYVSPGQPYTLADEGLSSVWPKQIQAVEMDKISAVLATDEQRVFPFPVRIDARQTGALEVDWQIINVSPAKHQGYAVQWFAMAAALAVLYLLRSSNLWQLIRGQGSRQE